MESQLSTALSLLGIGMITVFLVLVLVVQSGNLMIKFINWITPDVPEKSTEPDQGEIAAITAAVEIFTLGKGRITNIEKKN